MKSSLLVVAFIAGFALVGCERKLEQIDPPTVELSPEELTVPKNAAEQAAFDAAVEKRLAESAR